MVDYNSRSNFLVVWHGHTPYTQSKVPVVISMWDEGICDHTRHMLCRLRLSGLWYLLWPHSLSCCVFSSQFVCDILDLALQEVQVLCAEADPVLESVCFPLLHCLHCCELGHQCCYVASVMWGISAALEGLQGVRFCVQSRKIDAVLEFV